MSINAYTSAPMHEPFMSTVPQPFPSEHVNVEGATHFLTMNEWPIALQNTFIKQLDKMAFRFFIIDDSGSMAISDGHRLVGRGLQRKIVSCSRWSELTDAIRFHAQFAEAAQVPSEFRFLNRANPVLLGTAHSNNGLNYLLSMLDDSPSGSTPLCRHIHQVVQQIQAMEAQLRSRGEKAVVVIATDGESSDGDIASAMRPLQHLPVWVVIRLCTDEDQVCSYWNQIDKSLELDLDILDDLTGEAKEVHDHNSWLTYAEPLHRMREFGVCLREFDLLDEARLPPDSILKLISMILGGAPHDYPHPEADWPGFLSAIRTANKQQQMVWNPMSKGPTPWILPDKLGRYFGRSDMCEACVVS